MESELFGGFEELKPNIASGGSNPSEVVVDNDLIEAVDLIWVGTIFEARTIGTEGLLDRLIYRLQEFKDKGRII